MTTPLSEHQLKILMSSLNPARVQSRKQSGMSLSYLAAWDVKATLIRVFGFGGFSSELIEARIIREDQVAQKSGSGTNWKITAQASVKLTIHQTGAVYSETAIAGSTQPDFTEAADMAIKSAESDALKRAAIFLGTQLGLSLYDNGSTSEVIRTVVAPGQEFWNGQRQAPQRPAEPEQGESAPEAQREPQRGAQPLSGAAVTPEQKEANERVMNKLNRQVEEKATTDPAAGDSHSTEENQNS